MSSTKCEGTAVPAAQVYLRAEDLAQRWATTTRTLANWRNRGEGPTYIKLGSAVRYPLAAIERYGAGPARRGDGLMATTTLEALAVTSRARAANKVRTLATA